MNDEQTTSDYKKSVVLIETLIIKKKLELYIKINNVKKKSLFK